MINQHLMMVDGVRVFRIMKKFSQETIFSYVFGSLLFLFKSMIKSTALALKEKYSMVHVHNMPDYLVFSAVFLKLKRIPVILDIHDLTVELFKEKWSDKKFRIFKHILKFTEKVSCNFADHILTVTKECVDILMKRGIKSDKISLIMNSADENLFSFSDSRFSRDKDSTFKFLYHGTIAKRFGLHYFISAMPQILKFIPNAEFHIYGGSENEYSDELRLLISGSGLQKSVNFKESIPYAEVNEMIKDYDMGVITYEQTEYMNLAMPTKAGEYAITGLPFIISDMTSVRTIFREKSVCYVKPDDIESIVECIIKLQRDSELRAEMARSAYEDMLKISWNVMQKRYLDLFNTLTNTKDK
jgi:glycosyltransferase involved in cell wall biosynthesis